MNKKLVLKCLLLMTFNAFLCYAQEASKPILKSSIENKREKTIVTEKVITILELPELTIYPTDIDVKLNKYTEAEEMCKTLNNSNSFGYNNWRLPTKQEIQLMYMYRQKIKGLNSKRNYVSTEGILNFGNSTFDDGDDWKNKIFYLRPIRVERVLTSLKVSPSDVTFGVFGGEKTVEVLTNVEKWQVNSLEKWCYVVKNNVSFSVFCNPNDDNNDRSGKIVVIADDQEETITIFQECAKIDISQNNITFKSGSKESVSINIFTNMQHWEIVDIPEWCKVTKYESHFVVNCKSNVGKIRSAVIPIAAGNVMRELNITQEGIFSKVKDTKK